MRLIDADALKSFICAIPDIGLGLEPVITMRDVLEMIDHWPAVDAIPVEWIRGQMARCHNNSAMYQTANTLLQLWQKEQEATKE